MKTIVISDLSIGYKDKVVWQGLTADVTSGRLTCLLGVNGVGKSTLLRTIAGFQPPLAGMVQLANGAGKLRDVTLLSKSQLSKIVSVVLTQRPDVQNMTVREMVGMGRLPYSGFFGSLHADDERIVDEAMAATGIADFAPRMFHALSDGERQKVMIAKALAQQTPIILLDEPTAFLDYPSKVEMMKLLHRLATDYDKTILLSTHDLELALQLGDRLLTLDKGLREMSKEELREYMAKT